MLQLSAYGVFLLEALLINCTSVFKHGTEVLDHLASRRDITPLRRGRGVAESLAQCYYWFQIFMGIWGYLLCAYLSWTFTWRFAVLFILYMLYIAGPGLRAAREGSWPAPLRRWGVWRVLARYYPARLHKTAELDPSQPYVFGFHPHGIMPVSAWLTFCTTATGFDRLFPGVDARLLTLSMNFHGPILREYLLLHGMCDVTRATCTRLLKKGKSIAICVGGGTESLYTEPGTHNVILNRRKGFVRIALQTGASLVPVYSFGENNCYSTLNSLDWGHPLRKAQRSMQRAWGWTWPVAWGTGLLLPWGVLAYPVHINTVVGAPIKVPKYEGDLDSAEFHALVDKYHRLYCDALLALFREHKGKYAEGEQDLAIVE